MLLSDETRLSRRISIRWERQLFKHKLIPPFHTGPWGSLVSFVLGVHVTPVQIWAGPLLHPLFIRFRSASSCPHAPRLISHASAGGFLERDGFVHEFDDDLPDDVVVSMMRTPPLSCACPPGDGTRPIEMRGGNSSVFRHPHPLVDAVQSSAAFFSASTILSYLASVSVSIVASVDGSNASSSVQRSGLHLLA